MEHEEILTRSEVCTFLKISQSHLVRLRSRGDSVPDSFLVAGARRYKKSDLDQWRFEQEKVWTEIFKHVPRRAA